MCSESDRQASYVLSQLSRTQLLELSAQIASIAWIQPMPERSSASADGQQGEADKPHPG